MSRTLHGGAGGFLASDPSKRAIKATDSCRRGAITGAAASFLLATACSPALAGASLPSVQILKGTLTAPAAYDLGAATNGLCRDFPTNPNICVSTRAPEVVALSRALKGDPDLIYAYVHDTIRTEFQFGLQKGALGAIVDGSGTPADQAQLMVELLSQASVPVRYRAGAITLTAAQFTDWTGMINAKAVCDLLAAGGIPAAINGETRSACDYVGDISSVSLSHVWVETQIGGLWYAFDPSFKASEHRTGLDVRSVIGLTPGQPLTDARVGLSSSVQSGMNYVSTLNAAGLESRLSAYAIALQNRLAQSDMSGAGLVDLVGGDLIVPSASLAVSPLRQQTLPYANGGSVLWTQGVPDNYRTKLTVFADRDWNGGRQTVFNTTFFVDEIYGRPLGIESTRRPTPSNGVQVYDPFAYAPKLMFDGYELARGSDESDPLWLILDLKLTADHPFAGGFGDAVVEKPANFTLPMSIVHGWGNTSPRLATKWEQENGPELSASLPIMSRSANEGRSISSGRNLRSRIGASWLAQFSAQADLNAQLGNAKLTHLHSLGVVTPDLQVIARATPTPPLNDNSLHPIAYQFLDETTTIDLETAFALTSKTGDAVGRRAGAHAIAAVAATLEGGQFDQLMDSPDAGASTASRWAWGNTPEAGETPDTTSRKFFTFNAANASAAPQVASHENLLSGAWGTFQGQEPVTAGNGFKLQLTDAITRYTNAGFEVVTSSEAYLGPGYRHGGIYTSYYVDRPDLTPAPVSARSAPVQGGGSLVATKYVSGEPVQIAHVLTRRGLLLKGGTAPTTQGPYDPAKAADILKDRFQDRSSALGVNLSSGGAAFETPILQSVGQGAWPYRLDRQVAVRGAGLRRGDFSTRTPTNNPAGIVTNWDSGAQFGSSGSAALGENLQATIPAIVAFVAMQDIWRAPKSTDREVAAMLAANWWARSVRQNTVTVTQGAGSSTYYRWSDGSYRSPNGVDRMIVTGARTAFRPQGGACPINGCTVRQDTFRAWSYQAVDLAAVSSHGERKEFERWDLSDTANEADAFTTGFRLKRWRFPRGVDLTFTYADASRLREIPTRVDSSLGYGLDLPIPVSGSTNVATEATAVGLDALNRTTLGVFDGDYTRSSIKRPLTYAKLVRVYPAGDAVNPSVRYSYDPAGVVSAAADSIAIATPSARALHQFFIAPGFRGEREDPLGGLYSSVALPGGGQSIGGLSVASLTRHTDELGRRTVSLLDGRGRVLQREYPEHDRDRFKYDARDNVIEIRNKAKLGDILDVEASDIVVSAGWDQIWNKPSWIKDARGFQTDFTYVSSGAGAGEMWQAIQSAVDGARPVWTFEYAPNGQVSKITDPKLMQTVATYNAAGQPVEAATDDTGLRLRTCAGFDGVGNRVQVTDPRAPTCP